MSSLNNIHYPKPIFCTLKKGSYHVSERKEKLQENYEIREHGRSKSYNEEQNKLKNWNLNRNFRLTCINAQSLDIRFRELQQNMTEDDNKKYLKEIELLED